MNTRKKILVNFKFSIYFSGCFLLKGYRSETDVVCMTQEEKSLRTLLLINKLVLQMKRCNTLLLRAFQNGKRYIFVCMQDLRLL
jgi:hypothetical protein